MNFFLTSYLAKVTNLQIFNQYGKLIFEHTLQMWVDGTIDGDPVPMGSYWDLITLQLPMG